MKIYGAIVFLLAFVICVGSACYRPGGPVPENPLPAAPIEAIPQRVIVEQETIPSLAPGDIPEEYQEACNTIRFMRYRPETEGPTPKEVDAVLVMIPGYLAGANSFDYLGRQLVSMAEEDGSGSLEVWAVDRRPNCLEDLIGMNAGEAAEDPEVATNYYYFDEQVEGHVFQGFLSDSDVPFLSEFGLQLLMEDVYTIITTKIPDRNDRKNTVFIGGHSLGGPLTALFAGWDFDGNPATTDDAAYMNCAGLIGLDGPISAGHDPIGEETYAQRLEDIRSGASPRMDLMAPITPEAIAVLEALAMFAAFQPSEEATLFRDIPFSDEVADLIRVFHSRDLGHFLTGMPSIEDYRYTHEAMLGIYMDDNFQPVRILQVSLGFLGGGSVVEKTFPGNFADMFGLGGIIDNDGLFIAWDAGPRLDPGTGPLYTWVNFDEVAIAGDPDHQDFNDLTGTVTYTTMTEEVTDIQDFAQILFRGPTNFAEWYFASRLGLDMGAAGAAYAPDYGIDYLHQASAEALPKVEFFASDLPGYNHLDVLVAAVDRPSHRPNEVFGPMMDFAFTHSGGKVAPLD